MEKIKGIQQLVYDIIQAFRENGELSISKRRIKSELMKTEMANLDRLKYTGDSISKLDRSLDQALFQLKKKNFIKQKKHGEWSLIKSSNQGKTKYAPKPCRAIIPEYLSECQHCGYRKQTVSETPIKKQKCPNCGHLMTVTYFRNFCPIRKTFIGSPEAQCELLHGTDFSKKEKHIDPMKVCYFKNKPTDLGIQYARRKIELFEARQRANIPPKGRGF